MTRNALVGFGVVAVAFFVGVMIFYRGTFPGELSENHGAWGLFGDYVGGILNPVYGLLAFLGLLYMIQLQSENLKVARQELKESREEQRDSAALERQRAELMRATAFLDALNAAIVHQNALMVELTRAKDKRREAQVQAQVLAEERDKILQKLRVMYELDDLC